MSAKERKSCKKCLHCDICPIARSTNPEIKLLIQKFFGVTDEEIAGKCLKYLSAELIKQEKDFERKL